MHLLSQGIPYFNEGGFLIVDFTRVISEWVTWALVCGGRQSEANHDCDNHGQYRDTHFRHAFRGASHTSHMSIMLKLGVPLTDRRSLRALTPASEPAL